MQLTYTDRRGGVNVDANKFFAAFGLKPSGDSAEPGYRAMRVIQGHLDYNAQMKGMGEPESTSLDENATSELVHSVGKEKAKQIAAAFGFTLEGE